MYYSSTIANGCTVETFFVFTSSTLKKKCYIFAHNVLTTELISECRAVKTLQVTKTEVQPASKIESHHFGFSWCRTVMLFPVIRKIILRHFRFSKIICFYNIVTWFADHACPKTKKMEVQVVTVK